MSSPAKRGLEIRLDGVVIRGCRPVLALLDRLAGPAPRRIEAIRKLHREEMVAHWSVVAGKVREPILTAEVGGRSVVFGFHEVSGDLFLDYLDEIGEYWEMARDGQLRPVPVSARAGPARAPYGTGHRPRLDTRRIRAFR